MKHGQMLKDLMQTPNFRVSVVQEADTVEICGALKVSRAGALQGAGGGGMVGTGTDSSQCLGSHRLLTNAAKPQALLGRDPSTLPLFSRMWWL